MLITRSRVSSHVSTPYPFTSLPTTALSITYMPLCHCPTYFLSLLHMHSLSFPLVTSGLFLPLLSDVIFFLRKSLCFRSLVQCSRERHTTCKQCLLLCLRTYPQHFVVLPLASTDSRGGSEGFQDSFEDFSDSLWFFLNHQWKTCHIPAAFEKKCRWWNKAFEFGLSTLLEKSDDSRLQLHCDYHTSRGTNK